MSAITDAEFEEALGLDPEVVQRYLRGKGWHADRDWSGGELWERDQDRGAGPDPTYELLVPSRRRRDYAGRIADILETLAAVEARRPGDIIREMRLPPVDWQYLRLMPPGPSGTAPLHDVLSALTGFKDLHTAAASSALVPQAVQPGQKPQAVKDHVAAVRLDQTRIGSYVIAAHTPLRLEGTTPHGTAARRTPLYEQDAFPDRPGSPAREPFTRTVSRTLFAGVTCAYAAAEQTLERDSLADFEAFTSAGLSANLCEALVRVAGEERREFTVAFAWSAELPMVQDSPPVTLTPRHTEALEYGAKDLRERLGREQGALLVGMVTHLRAVDGGREATIYGSFDHEESARMRRVRVQLRPQDVDSATDAWRNRLEVAVSGNMEPRGNGLRMLGVTSFVVQYE